MSGATEMGEKRLGSVCIFEAVHEFYLVMLEQINNRITELRNMLNWKGPKRSGSPTLAPAQDTWRVTPCT